jgi:heme exporter protein D
MGWAIRRDEAAATVEAWIARVGTDWNEPRGTAWSDQDLLGHLSAWSDFLLDEVEALLAGRPDTIAAVDVDTWNAEQVERRRGWTARETIDEWRRAALRASNVARSLSEEARRRTSTVAWSASPVTIDDLLTLWVVHIEQHRARLANPAAWENRGDALNASS